MNSPNFSTFYLLYNLSRKFNLSNFIFYGVCLPQLGSVPSSVTAVIGLSNNDVISLRFLRSLRCVRCVGWKPRLSTVVGLAIA